MSGLENYLQEIGNQEFQDIHQIQIVRNPALDLMCERYKEWLGAIRKFMNMNSPTNIHEDYDVAQALIKEIQYSSNEIRSFSILLKEFEPGDWRFLHSGLFLSALINNSSEENFEILIKHLTQKIFYTGYKNTKNILFFGHAGNGTGLKMKGGKLVVKGNGDDCVGKELSKGEIIIEGDLLDGTGECMLGGKITVLGNTNNDTGHKMVDGIIEVRKNTGLHTGISSYGGEIHVEGKIESIGKNCKAKIYQGGKRIK